MQMRKKEVLWPLKKRLNMEGLECYLANILHSLLTEENLSYKEVKIDQASAKRGC